MRMPGGLKKLDDRVLGNKSNKEPVADEVVVEDSAPATTTRERTVVERGRSGRPALASTGDGLSAFLSVFWRISKLVLLVLGLVVLAAVAFLILPTNDDNVIVRNALSLAENVAGPFRDVFTADDEDRRRIYNYGLAAVVYFVLALVVGKLPTGSTKRG
jgi:hypothetical protein